MPNFCPECGSSQAMSRFCSSCGYSLAATPAPPDARTRVEDTPVFRPFAPPVAETWGNLAADPWSSTAGAMSPPPVRNVVTQTSVDVSETKLTVLKWLWRVELLATIAYGIGQYMSAAEGTPVFSTSTPGYVFSALSLVAIFTLTGVAASAARQLGAKTPHPVLAILLVLGAVFAAVVLGWLISPEYWADIEIASLYDKGLDRRVLYGVALLIQSVAVYVVALAPVVALSKAVGARHVGDAPMALLGFRGLVEEEPASFGWAVVWGSALIIGMHDIVVTGLIFGVPGADDSLPGGKPSLMLLAGPLILWRVLDFKKRSDIEADRAAKAAQELAAKAAQELAGEPEPRGFWRITRWWFLFIIGSFAVMFLLALLAAFLTSSFG